MPEDVVGFCSSAGRGWRAWCGRVQALFPLGYAVAGSRIAVEI